MLPTDIQTKIYGMVVNMRKPLYVSYELMEEVSGHTGMLLNILKKTQILNSSYMHVKYTNLSLLTYYLVITLSDKKECCDGNDSDRLGVSFSSDGVEFNGTINFEMFLIYDEIHLTKILLIISKCWALMCVKQRLRSYKVLTNNIL
tara:strand:+ start:150 stop:587 length:438 start_codon:yes stop_codon:yes gene_type:complete